MAFREDNEFLAEGAELVGGDDDIEELSVLFPDAEAAVRLLGDLHDAILGETGEHVRSFDGAVDGGAVDDVGWAGFLLLGRGLLVFG